MSTTDFDKSPTRAYRTGVADQSGRRAQNGFALWAMLALLAIAPLPFASARPFLWTLWAGYTGLVAVIFFAWQLRSGTALRADPLQAKLPAAMAILTLATLCLQILPLGHFPAAESSDVLLVTAQISVAPGQTLLMIARQLTYVLIGVLVMQVAASDRRRHVLLHGLIAIALVYGAYGLVALRMGDTILGLPKWAYLGSITGSFVNRNSFATFIGMGAILTLAHTCGVIRQQAERHKDDGLIHGLLSKVILYFVTYLFLMLIVIGTQSRMGLFATLAGSTLVVVATLVAIRRLGLMLLIAPLGIAALIGLFWLIGDGLLERIEAQRFDSAVRWELYDQILTLIAMRPLTGFGGGTFEIAFPLVHQLPVNADLTWNLAHSTYLSLWSELGLVGGSFLMIAIIAIGAKLATSLIRKTGSWIAQVAALAVIVQLALHSIVDFSLEIPANAMVFVAIVSAGLATTLNTASRKRTS